MDRSVPAPALPCAAPMPSADQPCCHGAAVARVSLFLAPPPALALTMCRKRPCVAAVSAGAEVDASVLASVEAPRRWTAVVGRNHRPIAFARHVPSKIFPSIVAATAPSPISLDGRALFGRGGGFQQGLNRGQQFGVRGRLRQRRDGGPLCQDVVAVEAGKEQERHGLRSQGSAHGTTI